MDSSRFWMPGFHSRNQAWRRFLAILFSLAALFSFPVLSAPADTTSMVLAVTVNGEAKGEFFIYATADGDHLVKLSDLQAMALRDLKGKTVDIDGEPHLSLRSVSGIEQRFDAKTLTLQIVAAGKLLGRTTIDLLPQRRPGVLEPRDNSAFFNYRLDYSRGDAGAAAYSLASEVGARLGDWLFLSGLSQVYSPGGERHSVRLMSNFTLDRRPQLQRLVLGDFVTSSGDLGSTLNLGGVSFSKRYTIDPYLVMHSMAGFAGTVTVPSEAEIYLDGMRVGTQKLPPGEFNIQNLNYYGGMRDIQIVIRDRFGREQRLDYHRYFSDTLLGEGLHEYSYDLGLMRQQYGVTSNKYDGLAASAFHRYGVSDALTVGLRGETAGGRVNLGPQTSFLLGSLGRLGTVSAGIAASHAPRAGSGSALLFNYSYQQRSFNANAFARRLSERYAQAMPIDPAQRPRVEAGAGLGYGSQAIGNFGVNYSTTTRYVGIGRRTVAVSYSKSLIGNLNLLATLSHVKDAGSANEIFVGLSWSPGNDITASYGYQDKAGTRSDTIQVSKNAPLGEGWGYRIDGEQDRSALGQTMLLSPYLQYNGTHGIYTASYRSVAVDGGGRQSSYQLGMAGAFAYVGGTLGISRPIDDSFGVVQVDGLKDVRVYQNNQFIGRTGPSGTVFIPNLGSYTENQIAIEDKDIPFDYSIAEKELFVSPPLRSGSLIRFPVTRVQAFTGTIKLRVDGALKPAEYYEGKVLVEGKPVVLATGKGGAFYLENLAAGSYRASLPVAEGGCQFTLTIPASSETVVELGEVVCEPVH